MKQMKFGKWIAVASIIGLVAFAVPVFACGYGNGYGMGYSNTSYGMGYGTANGMGYGTGHSGNGYGMSYGTANGMGYGMGSSGAGYGMGYGSMYGNGSQGMTTAMAGQPLTNAQQRQNRATQGRYQQQRNGLR